MSKIQGKSPLLSRRQFHLTAGAIAVAGLLGFSSAQAVEKSDVVIGIGQDWGGGAHAIMALEKGYFAEEGLEVELKSFSAGLVQVEALASRDLDFAIPTQAPVFSLRSAGVPILFLGSTAVWGEALSLAVRKDANIKEASDLVGKKFGVLKGSGSELMFGKILEHYGIDSKQVETVSLKPPEQLSSIISGLIDGVVVWEPWVQQAVDKADAVRIHTGATSHFAGNQGENVVVDWTRSVLTALEPTVQRYPETVDAVLRAMSRAQDFLVDPANADEAIALLSAFHGQDAEMNRKLMPTFEFTMALDERFLDGMNNTLDYLEQVGRIKRRVDVLDYTYVEPLKKVRPDAVTIQSNYGN